MYEETRFISYIYAYDKNGSRTCCGHAVNDAENNYQVNVSINLNKLKSEVPDDVKLNLYSYSRKNKTIQPSDTYTVLQTANGIIRCEINLNEFLDGFLIPYDNYILISDYADNTPKNTELSDLLSLYDAGEINKNIKQNNKKTNYSKNTNKAPNEHKEQAVSISKNNIKDNTIKSDFDNINTNNLNLETYNNSTITSVPETNDSNKKMAASETNDSNKKTISLEAKNTDTKIVFSKLNDNNTNNINSNFQDSNIDTLNSETQDNNSNNIASKFNGSNADTPNLESHNNNTSSLVSEIHNNNINTLISDSYDNSITTLASDTSDNDKIITNSKFYEDNIEINSIASAANPIDTSVNNQISEDKNTLFDNMLENNLQKPWEDEPHARLLLNTAAKYFPFKDKEFSECVRIKPQDIGTLPMEIWPLGSNSFLMHSYHVHNHILFSKRMNRTKREYFLMLPGTYCPREKYMADIYGFKLFKPINCSEIKNGDFGYWYVQLKI